MSRINVLVATTSPDLKAEIIAASVATRPDMILVENRPVAVAEVDTALDSITDHVGCALVIVGSSTETYELAQRFLDNARRDPTSRAYDERQATMLEYQRHSILSDMNFALWWTFPTAPTAKIHLAQAV